VDPVHRCHHLQNYQGNPLELLIHPCPEWLRVHGKENRRRSTNARLSDYNSFINKCTHIYIYIYICVCIYIACKENSRICLNKYETSPPQSLEWKKGYTILQWIQIVTVIVRSERYKRNIMSVKSIRLKFRNGKSISYNIILSIFDFRQISNAIKNLRIPMSIWYSRRIRN